MDCERCRRPMVSVATTIGDRSVVMHSCSACDIRQWESGGDVIDLTSVLDLTADASEKGRRPERLRAQDESTAT